jgi:PPM family protein phosphatase
MRADTTDKDDRTARRVLSPVLDIERFQTLSSAVRVELGATSRRGPLRSQNDDHYLAIRLARSQAVMATSLASSDLPENFQEQAFALVVADGLGDKGVGSLASRIALSTFAHLALHFGQWNVRIDSYTAAQVMDRARRFYEEINDAVRKRGQDNELQGLATTMTAAYSAGDDLFIAHVGHSRAYCFREGELLPLTADHTIAGRNANGPQPQAVPRSSQDLRHILTDTLGGSGLPDMLIEHFRLNDGDRLLLCTNGLTDVLDDDHIAETLSGRRRPQEDCVALAELAAARGGEDDVTVVLADYRIPTI